MAVGRRGKERGAIRFTTCLGFSARHAASRRRIGYAFSLRSNEKANRKSRQIVFFIDKPAVSAARPCRDEMGLYIGVRPIGASRVEHQGRMKNTFCRLFRSGPSAAIVPRLAGRHVTPEEAVEGRREAAPVPRASNEIRRGIAATAPRRRRSKQKGTLIRQCSTRLASVTSDAGRRVEGSRRRYATAAETAAGGRWRDAFLFGSPNGGSERKMGELECPGRNLAGASLTLCHRPPLSPSPTKGIRAILHRVEFRGAVRATFGLRWNGRGAARAVLHRGCSRRD
jgi:hypothetical protein